MAELEYSFQQTSKNPLINVRVSEQLIRRVSSTNQDFEPTLKRAVHAGSVVEAYDDNRLELAFDFKRSWRKRDQANKVSALRAAEKVLLTVSNYSADNPEAVPLYARFGTTAVADGRVSGYMVGRWPQTDSLPVAELATERMRRVAADMRYGSEMSNRQRNEMVYGRANREWGVTLQTNPMGSCSFDTDGSEYDPQDDYFELFAHNIYSPEQQIICLAGAIAITNADTLLATG